MDYCSPEVDMIDMLATEGPNLWEYPLKQFSLTPTHISTSSPSSQVSSESFEQQTSVSSSDLHFFHSPATTSVSNSLHYHHPQSHTPGQRQLPGHTMNLKGLTNQHGLASREDIIDMPLKLESQHPGSFGRNMSYFMPQLGFKVAPSSSASTCCESDIDSLDHFEEPFATHTVGTNCCLVHPIPKSSAYAAGNNISFLTSSDEGSPVSKVEAQDAHLGNSVFTRYSSQASTTSLDNTCGSSGPSHHTHSMEPFGLGDAKFPPYDDSLVWSAWNTNTPSGTWLPGPSFNDAAYTGGWHSPAYHHVSWDDSNNVYQSEGTCDSSIHHSGAINGLGIIPSSYPAHALSSSSPAHPHLHPASSPSETASTGNHPRPYPPMNPAYISSSHNVYHDTEVGSCSPIPKLAGSLSPSSFTPISTTTEEGPSPQRIKDDQTPIEANMHYTDERNAFLIDCKRRGLSYKDIKRVGGFKEAESTLRGRYRTLTKSKDQRVRKPKWQSRDVKLLCEAVSIHAEAPDTYSSLTHMGMTTNEPPKVSWKKVAEHIWDQGGSYQFGNATCKKKWCEIHNIRI
ncbi:unnamed protein product [Penicillium olsonii]|nr:unnamed protein product [Penicillium olsonii]